ncbi:MAG: hypothetical protein F6K14_28210 [Symploca sp. SIO2C1]|nr:hypothetical protein [Symploca sp. SIO2C1]
MTNHACVAVGINRYQFLRPLSYGQADAQELQQLLVKQANLPSEQCLLLTDSSALVGGHSTYPSRENILHWLGIPSQNLLLSEHWRWFFFSGYGVSWQEVDYLMPIDGNPDDIPGTGIPVRSLFESLKAQGNDKILVLLDINRSPGPPTGGPVGAETVELAQQMGIALVLSSQLNQYSHEAAALGKGLFTAALTEALRYYHTDTTLENLEQYLHERLPELSQHHWRPIQTPLTVIPTQKARGQLILPSVNFLAPEKASIVGNSKPNVQEILSNDYPNGTAPPLQNIVVSTVPMELNTSSIQTTNNNSHPVTYKPGAMIPSNDRQPEPKINKTPWWQQLLLWGGGILALGLIVMAVVLRIQNETSTEQLAETTNQEAVPGASPAPTTNAVSPAPTTNAVSPAPTTNAASPAPTTNAASPAPTTNAASPAPTTNAVSPAPTTNAASPAPTNAASPAPTNQPLVTNEQTSEQKPLSANQDPLVQAKGMIEPSQASLFSKAIDVARKVQPDDPLYQQAQQDISRWSQVMMDIAEGRAQKDNFASAIAAAKMIPKDDPSVHQEAQQAMEQWKVLSTQHKQNQGIIQGAKKEIKPNQASSYNRAITILSQVKSEQPSYAEAQQLKAQWSQKIYLMANTRAAQGKFQQAVETAKLVPQGTPSYQNAQKAIAKWNQGKR